MLQYDWLCWQYLRKACVMLYQNWDINFQQVSHITEQDQFPFIYVSDRGGSVFAKFSKTIRVAIDNNHNHYRQLVLSSAQKIVFDVQKKGPAYLGHAFLFSRWLPLRAIIRATIRAAKEVCSAGVSDLARRDLQELVVQSKLQRSLI